MSDASYPAGSVRTLLASDFVSPATRQALAARLEEGQQAAPRFFSPAAFATLRAACARLYAADGDPYDAAQAIDTRLADGDSDGWRYDELPPDGVALNTALDELEASAQREHGQPFAALAAAQQDALIAQFQQAHPRVFEELLAETTETAYSHPLMQEEIGYAGMADQAGWQRIGLNEREDWEPHPGAALEIPVTVPPRPATPRVQTTPRRYAEADVVVIGTGAGGAPIIARLAAAGLKVVALEAGRVWNPAEEYATDERAQHGLFWNDERLSAGNDPIAFGRNNSGRGVGGSTLHFTAYTPRAQPDDFQLYSEYGQGCDWPIGYQDLEAYYDEVEQFIGVSGPSPYPWGPTRKRGYPLAPLPLNSAAQLMQRGCEQLGIQVSPAANAALSADYTSGVGKRHACTNRGFCQAGCNNGAKGSVDVTYLPLAQAAGAEIRAECFVTGFERDASGRIRAVIYEHAGATERIPCTAVFLCAGAIESPRLLLLNDLANSSGQVGRNFMAHVGPQVWAQFPEYTRPTKGIPGGLISEDTHRVPGAGFVGGYLLQSIGVMPVTYAGQMVRGRGLWGEALREHMRGFNHVAGINVLGDCLPYDHNFLELAEETDARGLPKPRVHFTAGENEQRMTKHAIALMRQIFEAAGGTDIWEFPRYAHIIGTCRMGEDARAAVVDADCRSHDVPNLYICDNSVFPSALSVNPALTIMALALRTADRFLARKND